jgi:hypothetical protein
MPNISNVLENTRKLAKTNNYQLLFSMSKEYGFRLFENARDFSYIQKLFINYLSFYSALNFDVSLGDVQEIVLDNEIYEDSYMYYKNIKKNKEKEKKQVNNPINATQWILTNKNKIRDKANSLKRK